MPRVCPQCGASNSDTTAFCAQCGTTLGPAPAAAAQGGLRHGAKTSLGISTSPEAAPPATAARVEAAQTVLGMPAVSLTPNPPGSGAAIAAPASAPGAPAAAPSNRTVLGMPAIALPAPGASPASATPNPSAAARIPENRTMLGVARPGIAPLNAGVSQDPSPAPAPQASVGARADVASENRTMLGVQAVPGQPAPRPMGTGAIPVLPAPPPLDLEPLPTQRMRPDRKGAPLGLVAGGLAAVLIGVIVVAVVAVKSGGPLVVQPRLSPKGTDVLHLKCEGCPDGTKVKSGDSTAEFKNKETDLELKQPLKVGENALVLSLERPGARRSEDVKAPVPVRYRIRTDVSAVAEQTPLLKIMVEAESGAQVKIDGKPLGLDASGKGFVPIDLTADCTGMADESKTIDRAIPYEVAFKDHTEKGSVAARVGVPALRVDAPLARTLLASTGFFVAGRTVKGATIALNGKPVTADASGIFAESFGAPTTAEIALEIRATVPQSAPRIVQLKVRRVEQLEAQARSLEKTATAIPYSALAGNTTSYAGTMRAVEGDIIEVRVTNHQSLVLVRDRKQCDRPDGACIVRIVHGAEVEAGKRALAVGRVTRAITANGTTYPEIEADILVPFKR